jgi:hypothetical protein
MLYRAICFLLLLATPAFANELTDRYAALGNLIVEPFATAPFPHPARSEGHHYHTNFFSAEKNYSDNHVAMFIPNGFRPGGKTDFVVHFHGWGNSITNAFIHYKLAEQFTASKRNAILIVPQGPFNAMDSFDGKMEDPNGFKNFMAEVVSKLQAHGVIKNNEIGKIILSGHSGGYEAISSIVAWGGLSDRIREVWLFDALYANTERFVVWFDHHPSRFIDIYTDHGGTKEETENLMAALKGNGVSLYQTEESAVDRKKLTGPLVFIHTDLIHDQVMQQTDNFQHFLETSSLGKLRH